MSTLELNVDYDVTIRVRGGINVTEKDYERALGRPEILDKLIIHEVQEKIDNGQGEIEVEWS